MNSLELKIGDKTLRDGTIFRSGAKKYRVNFSEAENAYNIDLWDFQAEKPLSLIGTMKRDGTANYGGFLNRVDEILEN